MDIRRVHRVLAEVLDDLAQNDTEQLFQDVVDSLSKWANQTSQATGEAYAANMRRFIESHSNSRVGSLQPLSARILKLLGGEDLLGRFKPQNVRNLVRVASSPAEALPKIQAVHGDFADLVSMLRALHDSLESLGVEALLLEEGQSEIAAIVPCSTVSNRVSDSQDEIQKWARAVGNIADAVGESRDSVELAEVERGSLIVIFGVSVFVAGQALDLINKLLDAYKKVQEIRIHHAKIAELGVGEEALKSVEDEINRVESREIDSIVESVLDRISENKNGRVSNEQRALFKKSAEFFMHRIDQGSQVEVVFRLVEVSADAQEEGIPEAGEGGSNEPNQELLDDVADKWVEVKELPKRVLALDEPALDSDSADEPAERDPGSDD